MPDEPLTFKTQTKEITNYYLTVIYKESMLAFCNYSFKGTPYQEQRSAV
jgi:hypothetical protein